MIETKNEIVHSVDPDLLLVINEIKDAIVEVMLEQPMSLCEMEALGFPGEKPQSWTTTLVLLAILIGLVACSAYGVNYFFDTLKTQSNAVETSAINNQ